VLVIGADSSPTDFSIEIRCCFRRGLEIGEFSLAVSRARAQTQSRHCEEDGGRQSGRCRPRAGAAGFAGPRHMQHTLERPGGLVGPIPK
jgi:hypothetical protein